jgi:hypothetical protein
MPARKSKYNRLYDKLTPFVKRIKFLVTYRPISCRGSSEVHGFIHKLMAKKLFSLKPVVRARRSYQRVGLEKRQKSLQGLAMYDHEALMSLQTRAKFLETQSTTSVTV